MDATPSTTELRQLVNSDPKIPDPKYPSLAELYQVARTPLPVPAGASADEKQSIGIANDFLRAIKLRERIEKEEAAAARKKEITLINIKTREKARMDNAWKADCVYADRETNRLVRRYKALLDDPLLRALRKEIFINTVVTKKDVLVAAQRLYRDTGKSIVTKELRFARRDIAKILKEDPHLGRSNEFPEEWKAPARAYYFARKRGELKKLRRKVCMFHVLAAYVGCTTTKPPTAPYSAIGSLSAATDVDIFSPDKKPNNLLAQWNNFCEDFVEALLDGVSYWHPVRKDIVHFEKPLLTKALTYSGMRPYFLLMDREI